MYNYSGIYYFIILGGIIAILGLQEFLRGRPFDSQHRITSRIIIGVLACIFGLIVCAIHIAPLANPQIETYSGEYCRNNNSIKVPFQSTWIFSNDIETKSFNLDIFSMKKIYPESFEIGETYTIHYVDVPGGEIIVRIDG